MNGSDMFEDKQSSAGGIIGARLAGSFFVPLDMGLVFEDDSTPTRYWQLRLARNANGTVFIGDDGLPTIELFEVVI